MIGQAVDSNTLRVLASTRQVRHAVTGLDPGQVRPRVRIRGPAHRAGQYLRIGWLDEQRPSINFPGTTGRAARDWAGRIGVGVFGRPAGA